MSAAKTLLSAEKFDNYPFEEDKRYELDEGELIEMTRPAYRHNPVLKRLLVRLDDFLERTGLGEAMISENLYAIAPQTRRAPDVAVILGDRRRELEEATVIEIVPDIVAEVISPSETTRMIQRKLMQYFAAGVKELWLVYPEAREVEIWTDPNPPEQSFAGNTVLESALLPGFKLPLEDLFA